ncbi:nuclear RNA export factor 3 [Nycticebus coucang]|uniref:nuclear RNA export factor 3 n=1 Tax=Nycticebus coucang TaxID=9470 RepID=UPI00234DB53F|nr:nuclear RNA export factor 3 [Nycticebus coucang]
MGHNHQGNPVQRRARCWGLYRRRFTNWSEPVTFGMNSSFRQQQEGSAAMSDIQVDSPVRFNPYAIPPYHRRGTICKQDQTQVITEREKKLPEGRMEWRRQDGTSGNWFKITIPFGIKYDEKWLLDLIQSQCSVPFTPFEFHYEKMQAHFFVESASIAFALKSISGNIWDQDNERISIIVSPSDVPHFVQKELKKVEQLTTNKYDTSQEAFDIQKLRFNTDLRTHDVIMAPNHGQSMAVSLHTEEEKMSQVTSAEEMDKEKGQEPEEICVDRNVPCTTFPDKSGNINSILELFPKLLCLDGQESPSPNQHGTEAHKMLPVSKGSIFASETLKSLVMQFLQQYYLIYDYGDRQSLLGAYHAMACFSLTIPFNHKDLTSRNLRKYFKESRNMIMLKDPYLRRQLLKHTKCDIVDTLKMLPQTQHDLTSFLVDMWFQTERMLCVSVSGLFKEVEGKSLGCVRAFSRIFITVPTSNSSLCIINDELFVRDISFQEIQGALSIPTTTPYSSYVHALSQEQQNMVEAFSAQFGMNLKWSQKYLHDTRATEVLALPNVVSGNSVQAKGKIPEESQYRASTD